MPTKKSSTLFELEVNYHRRRAKVVLRMPVELRSGGFVYEIQFIGMPPPDSPFVFGVDTMQALVLALANIQRHLESLGIYPVDHKGNVIAKDLPRIFPETELLSTDTKAKIRDAITQFEFDLIKKRRKEKRCVTNIDKRMVKEMRQYLGDYSESQEK